MALTEILITDMVPLRFRGNYYALLGTVLALGSVMGPIVGGALATRQAWRVSNTMSTHRIGGFVLVS
jgi:MFS family permease